MLLALTIQKSIRSTLYHGTLEYVVCGHRHSFAHCRKNFNNNLFLKWFNIIIFRRKKIRKRLSN